MKTAALVLLACACASVQAQEVRLEHTDTIGNGVAFLGSDEIEIDLILDIPGPMPLGLTAFTVVWDTGLVSLNSVAQSVPTCPAPGPCLGFLALTSSSADIFFEDVSGFNGLLTLATFSFTGIQTGGAEFEISAGGISPPGINYLGTTVTIVDIEYGQSGSLPEEFEVPAVGLPAGWSTFFNVGPESPRGSDPDPVWRNSAEPGACDFGNVTNGDGNAACLQNGQSAKGPGNTAGSLLCTDSPLDLSEAVLPVLGLLANFQPGLGGATFRVITGNTPPPDTANYTTRFETTDPIGQFESLPGEMLTIALPSELPLYICIVVEGDYAYAEVDECISCAVSYGAVPDVDADGISDNVDNCDEKFNPDQRDTNHDGIGNACDADIAPATNDCIVNALDMQAIKTAFFAQEGEPNYNPDADFDGNGVVNFVDLGVMRLQYWGPPGPSGLLNACNAPQRALRLRDCAIPD